MRVESWDSVFVRARRADIHPIVRDVIGYGRWWPGVTAAAKGDAVALRLRPRGPLRRAHEITVRIAKDRPDLGIDLRCAGALDGEAEWFYLDERAGTVVHYLVRAEALDRGWRRLLRDHRAVVRAGLHSLKDRLEAGRVPGAEPDPVLLADQAEAQRAFTAAVDAHSAAQAKAAE